MKNLNVFFPWVTCFAGLVPIATVASTQTLTVTLQVTNITYEYALPEFVGFGWIPGSVTHKLEFTPVTLTNVNLTTYSTFVVRIIAPAGQKFFTYTTNYESYVDATLIADSDSGGHSSEPSLAFEQFAGEFPIRSFAFAYIGNMGNVVHLNAAETYAGWVQFSEMNYSFTTVFSPTNAPKTFQMDSRLFFGHGVLPEETNNPVITGPFMVLATTNNVPSFDTLHIQKAVEVSWISPRFDLLQPEWTDDVGTNAAWHPLGRPMQVSPGTNRVYDLTSLPHRLYRLRRP